MLVDQNYSSNQECAQQLELGLEMLFYVEEDAFDRREIQNVAYALKGIIGALREGE